MTDYQSRAAFVDQVEPGQQVRLAHDPEQTPWTVTEKRVITEESIRGGTATTVHLLGVSEDGTPQFFSGPSWTAMLIYEPVGEAATP